MPTTGLQELIIRVDERVKSFEKLVERLEQALKEAPCERNTERIKTLERFTWAAITASVVAFIKAFWFGQG